MMLSQVQLHRKLKFRRPIWLISVLKIRKQKTDVNTQDQTRSKPTQFITHKPPPIKPRPCARAAIISAPLIDFQNKRLDRDVLQQQLLTVRQRQLIGYSQRPIRDESSKPRRENDNNTNLRSVCAKTRRIKETAETADVRVQHIWSFRPELKDSSVQGCYSACLLSLDPHPVPSRFPHVHCDFSKEVKLVYFHHFVGQRVDPIFKHSLSGVGDSVEPGREEAGEKFIFQQVRHRWAWLFRWRGNKDMMKKPARSQTSWAV